MTTDKLDDLLWFLAQNGEWHTLSEVAEAIRLSEERVEIAASFFDEFHFVSFNRDKRRVRIHPMVRQLYLEEPQEVP